ncbi:MAG: DNA polymerase III subunit delta' [Chloroflexi bacterium]|nr:MAG: DNA polymerase III subunit delta' [Chloroflexota bacterium]
MSDSYRIPVYGHAWAQRLLRTALASGRTAHAYLLAGPDHVGKTTLARALAQALTCESPEPTADGLGACGRCRGCRLAAEQVHPDHRLIEPDEGVIKIDQVRDLIREASLSPVEGRYKVFIIRSFDRANANAANALLKTLEEPNETTRILLTSSQTAALLPTITSRCQVIRLRAIPGDEIARALEEHWHVPAEQAALLAGLSGGRLGWAVAMATDPAAWQRHNSYLEATQALLGQSLVERLTIAHKLAGDSALEEVLHSWLLWWRDVLMYQLQTPELVLNRHRLPVLEQTARRTRPADVRRFLEALMATADYLRTNVNTILALEALLLKAPRPM